jgi:hypothetical protein
MAANWFLRTTDSAASWALREADALGPAAGVLRFVGQAPTASTTTGIIDGGGEIAPAVEQSFTAFYALGGTVQQTFTALYQIPAMSLAAAGGTLRVVGQAPTTAVTIGTTQAPLVGTLRVAGLAPTVAWTGSPVIAPSTGTLRFAGGIPSLDPKVVSPSRGTVRLVGQPPPLVDVAHKFAAPGSGTLRFVCQGEATRDFTAIWQRTATAEASFSATWQTYIAVGLLRINPRQASPGLTTGQNTIRATTGQRRLSLARAA